MTLRVELREFIRADNVDYSSWFANPSMNKYLGPAWTSAELDQIFKEEPGSILSAFCANELVGVVSIALPNGEDTSYGVTGVAVKPQKQRQGLGAEILKALQSYYKTSQGQEWMGFVSKNNGSAQKFLEMQGWTKAGVENEMYRYSLIQSA